MPQSKHLALGKQGEQLAAEHLQQHGYIILAANWRCLEGEIDLIAQRDAILVFVEVRTRRSGTEAAFASIGARKRHLIEQAAYRYLAERDSTADENVAWRVDVIAVAIPPQGAPIIEHVEDALGW